MEAAEILCCSYILVSSLRENTVSLRCSEMVGKRMTNEPKYMRIAWLNKEWKNEEYQKQVERKGIQMWVRGDR